MRLPPSSTEAQARSAALSLKIKQSMEAFEKLPPIEQAMHWLDQRRSFVRGECGSDVSLNSEPAYVVLKAYRELKQQQSQPVAWQYRIGPKRRWNEASLAEREDMIASAEHPYIEWRPLYAGEITGTKRPSFIIDRLKAAS